MCVTVLNDSITCLSGSAGDIDDIDDLRAAPMTLSNHDRKQKIGTTENAYNKAIGYGNAKTDLTYPLGAVTNSLDSIYTRLRRQSTSCTYVYYYDNQDSLCGYLKELKANSNITKVTDTIIKVTYTDGYISPGAVVGLAVLCFILGMMAMMLYCKICGDNLRWLHKSRNCNQNTTDMIDCNAKGVEVLADVNIQMNDPVYRDTAEDVHEQTSPTAGVYEQLQSYGRNDNPYNVTSVAVEHNAPEKSEDRTKDEAAKEQYNDCADQTPKAATSAQTNYFILEKTEEENSNEAEGANNNLDVEKLQKTTVLLKQ